MKGNSLYVRNARAHLGKINGASDRAYLIYIALKLIEMHQILTSTEELSKLHFSKQDDILLFYTKSARYILNVDTIRVPYKSSSGYAKSGICSKTGKQYLSHPQGTPIDDTYEIPMIHPMSRQSILAILHKS